MEFELYKLEGGSDKGDDTEDRITVEVVGLPPDTGFGPTVRTKREEGNR